MQNLSPVTLCRLIPLCGFVLPLFVLPPFLFTGHEIPQFKNPSVNVLRKCTFLYGMNEHQSNLEPHKTPAISNSSKYINKNLLSQNFLVLRNSLIEKHTSFCTKNFFLWNTMYLWIGYTKPTYKSRPCYPNRNSIVFGFHSSVNSVVTTSRPSEVLHNRN